GAQEEGTGDRQVEHDGHDDRAGDQGREVPADGADEGVEGGPDGVLDQGPHLRQALGAGGDDVRLVQLVPGGGGRDPAQPGGAARPQDDDGDPQLAQHVPRLRRAPRGLDVGGREEPADALPEVGVGDPHEDEGEEEVRGGQADEADEGGGVVPDRVLPHGG